MLQIFLVCQLICFSTFASTMNETAFPLFLRMGFSSVLEFSQAPEKVVLGDSQAFQIEKMEKSLVIRTMVPYATTNMFVYFKEAPTQIFTLTADEEANPTNYRKIEVVPSKAKVDVNKEDLKINVIYKKDLYIKSATFDKIKDYLTVNGSIIADSGGLIAPKWDAVRLSCSDKKIAPYKLWSERKDVQKDSAVKYRFIFLRPNVGKNLKSCKLIVPVSSADKPLTKNL